MSTKPGIPRVRFENGAVAQTFLASRPEILPLLQNCAEYQSSGDLSLFGPGAAPIPQGAGARERRVRWVLEFAGNAAELIDAGLAHPGWFHEARQTRCGGKTGSTEFGDRWTLQRRPQGQWELCLCVQADTWDPWSDHRPHIKKSVAWRIDRPRAQAVVKEALARLTGA